MDIEVINSPELSVGEPPSVPSQISVVLVEEAKAGGTPRLGCSRVDQDIQLLAGVAKPASVTFCEDSHGSPCVGGKLSSSDIAGRLLPVVPAGIPFPVGPVDPAGPDYLYVAGGPVGPYGTLSPSDSEPAGSVGPYVAGGPVGPDGTLSPFISDPAGPDGPYVASGPVGPYGTLSPSDSEPAGSVGPYVAGGPVGPYGTLSPSDSEPAGSVGPCVAGGPVGPDGPYVAGGPVGPYLTLNLLALSARMLQVASLAWMGRCPRLPLTLLARMACMLQAALLARMGDCPRLTPVLRYWWTLVECSHFLTLHLGVHYFRVKKDRDRVQFFRLMIWCR